MPTYVNLVYSVGWSQFLNHYPWYTDQNKLGFWGFTKIKQYKQYGDSLSVTTPLVHSHTDNFTCLFTIGDMNNPSGQYA